MMLLREHGSFPRTKTRSAIDSSRWRFTLSHNAMNLQRQSVKTSKQLFPPPTMFRDVGHLRGSQAERCALIWASQSPGGFFCTPTLEVACRMM